jgi:hypothetical protein
MKMHKLIFKNDKARTLAKMMEHSNAHKRRIPYTQDETEDQGLWLVKDEGIYLMSPTDDRFDKVVYARGYKPTNGNRDTLWDKTHEVSRDDFAEFVRLTPNMVFNVLGGGDLTIKLSETKMVVWA